MIEIRNRNYKQFYKILQSFSDKLYIPEINDQISSFAFPIICKSKKQRSLILRELEKNKIEYRPIVSGNLLKQPFLKNYAENKTMPNADILHTNGVYISNNHFVGDFELNLLKDALAKALCN